MSRGVACAVCRAEIHLELGRWMTVWPGGRKTVVCRRCHRTGAWKSLGEDRPPVAIGPAAAVDAAAEPEEAELVDAGEGVAGLEGEKMSEETTITKKCKGCKEDFEAQDGRVQRCPKCLGAPTVARNGFSKRKARPVSIDELVDARIREIAGEGGGLDAAAVEEIVDRMLTRKLKDRFKAFLG